MSVHVCRVDGGIDLDECLHVGYGQSPANGRGLGDDAEGLVHQFLGSGLVHELNLLLSGFRVNIFFAIVSFMTKDVDEQGQPFPPEEAVCGFWVVTPEEDTTGLNLVVPTGLTRYGTEVICKDLGYYDGEYNVPYRLFVPCNKTTKDLLASWNAECLVSIIKDAQVGTLLTRIQQLGVFVSRSSIEELSDDQFLHLKEILDTADEMEDGVEDTKVFENLVLKVFKEKK